MVSRGIGVFALVGLLPHSFFDGVAISAGSWRATPRHAHLPRHPAAQGADGRVAGERHARQRQHARAGAARRAARSAWRPCSARPSRRSSSRCARYGLAIAAGVTLYVAASNLVPEAQHERSWLVQGGLFAGVVAFFLVSLLLPGALMAATS
jgi:zinc and cadmium transporter